MVETAEQVFDAPTRVGLPQKKYMGGLLDELEKPDWAVCTGLAISSMRSQIHEQDRDGKSPTKKVAEWFENFRGKFS